MQVRFKSSASADVKMPSETASFILGIIGKPIAERGIITVEQLPDALARLEAAIHAEEEHRAAVQQDGHSALHHHDRDAHPEVSRIDHRGWPMREMLRQARDEGVIVMWGV